MPPEADHIEPQDIQHWQKAKKRKLALGEKRRLGERVSVNVRRIKRLRWATLEEQPIDANENPGFGFRTWSARMVFEMAQKLIALYPAGHLLWRFYRWRFESRGCSPAN